MACKDANLEKVERLLKESEGSESKLAPRSQWDRSKTIKGQRFLMQGEFDWAQILAGETKSGSCDFMLSFLFLVSCERE